MTPDGAASDQTSGVVVPVAKEYRHRANVLLVGDALSPVAVSRLQESMRDEANVFRPAAAANDLKAVATSLDAWLEAKQWDAIFLGVKSHSTEEAETGAEKDRSKAIAARLKRSRVLTIWAAEVPHNSGEDAGAAVANCLHRALLSRSSPWAELPARERHDPAHLLADPQLLAAPEDLVLAQGSTSTVYRAKANAWQFNLHSFIAHHDGKFWAIWSSGRVDEDSSSQLLRYATSVDGKVWSEAQILAPDPDGESGPWRWMASGIYEDGERLFALGSQSRGDREGKIWADARLVRFEWTEGGWKKSEVVADDSVAYFPPLRFAGRDFFVSRDSYGHFSTAYRSVGETSWKTTRLPGPLPEYRMSETSTYVDPDGVVHLIIRDQGETRRIYHSVSFDAGATWTLPVKTDYPDAVSKNCSGRLSNGWYYLINNPKARGADARDPLAISFSRDGWTFGAPMALRKGAPPLRYPGKAKGSHSFQYSHAIEYAGKLCVVYSTNKEDIEVTFFDLRQFNLTPL